MIWNVVLFVVGFVGGVFFWKWHLRQIDRAVDAVVAEKENELRHIRASYQRMKQDADARQRCAEASDAYKLGLKNGRREAA